ncbi:H17B6-like protein [Mya arenaria]|uniref:H17B6-like protein n=1 Tax=Mya arenaria TaxID=6604 RepID=A0ABY7DFZ0_MYAAR|nr:17-beta-hydroxysteroid dehydrogenase type 6-like [Mya arenaria]WAQ96614.1 H17B6-like protein [Mya arenaria]
MCPVLCILAVLLPLGLLVALNKYFRSRRLPPADKAVFITGCDRGFGETLAAQLSAGGYRIFAGCLNADSDGARKLRVNSNVTVIPVDVTSDEAVQAAVDVMKVELGEKGLWALVNNAGVAVFAETEWCTMAAYNHVIGVNLLGAIRVTKACLPLVRKTRGRVVNISSLAGRFALPGFTAYSASKFGCIGFSDALRREMEKFGVHVACLEPKLYRTAISDGEFHVRTCERMWAETADDVKVDYGDTYFRAFLDAMLKNLKYSSRRTYQVTDDLVHAVTAVYPYRRYVPSLKMQMITDAFMVQPQLVQDRGLLATTGVKCTPFSMRQRKAV